MNINTKYTAALSTSPILDTNAQFLSSRSIQTYGRVKRVVLDESNPDFETFGRSDALYGVRVYPLDSQLDEDQIDQLPFARNYHLPVTTVPLLNEIVEIFQAPSQLSPPNTQIGRILYYSRIINVSNNPNHNALPEATDTIEEIELGLNVPEQTNRSVLYPFPGDTLLQGRNGGSIRISGYLHPKNQFTNTQNNGKPFIILQSNLTPESTDIPPPSIESLNDPGSTIFLGTDHNLFLKTTYNFKHTYKENPRLKDKYKPTEFTLYKGTQTGINSGRITLHSYEDSIFLIGKESVGLLSNTINLESKLYTAIEGSKIYLGKQAKQSNPRKEQPAVRGKDLVDWQKDLLRELRQVALKLATITNPAQAVGVLNQIGSSLVGKIGRLESNLSKTQSKKVFIE